MPRGGRRKGRPGAQYPNRVDLQLGDRQQPIMRPPSTQYGEQAELVRQQQALPVSAAPAPAPMPASTRPPMPPTQIIPLDSPTMRPDEPLTAGAPFGPGPGPSFTRMREDPIADEVRALYVQFPYAGLREILEDLDG